MPELSRGQFQPRLFDPGPGAYNRPDPSEGEPPTNPNPPAGQLAMQVDRRLPTSSASETLALGRGGILPVTEASDPFYSKVGFDIGGAKRGSMTDHGRNITKQWESLPVETIPGGATVRAGQTANERTTTGKRTTPEGKRAWRPNSSGVPDRGYVRTTMVEDPYIDKLKGQPEFADNLHDSEFLRDADPTPKHPWVIEANPSGDEKRRYIVEGNHRAAAMRERGTGEMTAHVYRGKPGQSVDAITRDFTTEVIERSLDLR